MSAHSRADKEVILLCLRASIAAGSADRIVKVWEGEAKRLAQRVIIDGVARGVPVKKLCEPSHMPGSSEVFLWLADNANEREFAIAYNRAREAYADLLGDEIVSLSDEATDNDNAAAVRVRVEARKWVAGKLKPQKWADNLLALGQSGEGLTIVLGVFPGPQAATLVPASPAGPMIEHEAAAARAAGVTGDGGA